MVPYMYKIEYEGKNYLDQVKKFAVSKDCMITALVMHNNKIMIHKLFDYDQSNVIMFTSDKKFSKECKIFEKHPETHKDIIDIFIIKNKTLQFGEG